MHNSYRSAVTNLCCGAGQLVAADPRWQDVLLCSYDKALFGAVGAFQYGLRQYLANLGPLGPSTVLTFAAFSILTALRGLPVLPSSITTAPE